MTEAAAKKLSFAEMADLLETRFIGGCRLMDGKLAGETWLRVEADQLDGLKQIAAALAYMAPHQDGIRRMIARTKA